MADFDSPWKEVLDCYFEWFLAFFLPQAHAEIDWSRGYEMLDKELQKIVPESEQGRRIVDKLVKVWLKSGEEWWLLVHVEVQASSEGDFPLRMHVYNYRIFDRYNREVVSLAVLADADPDWRPTHYSYGRWGARTTTEFVTFKLLDYALYWQALEAHPNPFALVVLAHLKTLETRRSPTDRQAWKVRLIRKLYERGLTAKDVRQLFRFIDCVMELPKPLKQLFWQEITRYDEEKPMAYVTTPEQLAREEIYTEGIEMALEFKFGAEGLKLLPEIRDLDHEMLQRVFRAIKTAKTPDSLRRIWAPGGSEPPSSTATQEEDIPSVTTPEWVPPEWLALRHSLIYGIEVALEVKFGAEGLKLMPEILKLTKPEVLQTVLKAIPTAATPNELRRVWTP